MQLPPGVMPNSSLPGFSREFNTEAALHRMSNGELWLVINRAAKGDRERWVTLRKATDQDALEFSQAGLAIVG